MRSEIDDIDFAGSWVGSCRLGMRCREAHGRATGITHQRRHPLLSDLSGTSSIRAVMPAGHTTPGKAVNP